MPRKNWEVKIETDKKRAKELIRKWIKEWQGMMSDFLILIFSIRQPGNDQLYRTLNKPFIVHTSFYSSLFMIWMLQQCFSYFRSFPAWSRITGSFSHFLMVVNSSVNIFLYCLFNAQFRKVARIVITDFCRRRNLWRDERPGGGVEMGSRPRTIGIRNLVSNVSQSLKQSMYQFEKGSKAYVHTGLLSIGQFAFLLMWLSL